jgi:hypothetical protein
MWVSRRTGQDKQKQKHQRSTVQYESTGVSRCRPSSAGVKVIWPRRQEGQAGNAGLLFVHHDVRRQQGVFPVLAPYQATPPPSRLPLDWPRLRIDPKNLSLSSFRPSASFPPLVLVDLLCSHSHAVESLMPLGPQDAFPCRFTQEATSNQQPATSNQQPAPSTEQAACIPDHITIRNASYALLALKSGGRGR